VTHTTTGRAVSVDLELNTALGSSELLTAEVTCSIPNQRPAIRIEVHRGFPQSVPENAGILPRKCQVKVLWVVTPCSFVVGY